MSEHQESERHEYLEEERVPEHSGTNHSMAIGFYIAAILLIFGVTIALVGILAAAQPGRPRTARNYTVGAVRVPRPYASATTTRTPASSISRSVSPSAPLSVTKTSTRESGAIFASATTPSFE